MTLHYYIMYYLQYYELRHRIKYYYHIILYTLFTRYNNNNNVDCNAAVPSSNSAVSLTVLSFFSSGGLALSAGFCFSYFNKYNRVTLIIYEIITSLLKFTILYLCRFTKITSHFNIQLLFLALKKYLSHIQMHLLLQFK